MIRSRLLVITLIALGAQPTSFAETLPPLELQPYSQRIEESALELVADIRPVLDEHAAQVLDTITFEARSSWETNARSYRSMHGRRVVFSSGLLAVTDWLSLAMIAEKSGHDGCFREYFDYLIQVAGRNSRRLKRSMAHKLMKSFETYASGTRGSCAGADASVAADENLEARERILDGIVATVLLHEIAHHVLGHVELESRNFLQERMREIAADQWATRTALKADYDLRPAVPLFLFLAASGGGTLEADVRGSHPSGLRRVRDLLVQTRDLLDDKDPTGARRMDVSIAELNRAL
jgi:hypothetical protein